MEKEVLCGGCELWSEDGTAIKEEGRFWSVKKKAEEEGEGSLRGGKLEEEVQVKV